MLFLFKKAEFSQISLRIPDFSSPPPLCKLYFLQDYFRFLCTFNAFGYKEVRIQLLADTGGSCL
jgi:hypothetical protein